MVGQRAEMTERVALDALEPALRALLDHARIEIDARTHRRPSPS
jgi:hypothetical protein